eukprot:m.38259 g.38259  ORF g.38259 m.38259 type:complete len:376 (-) comp17872_c0_seq1:110-1237(-)
MLISTRTANAIPAAAAVRGCYRRFLATSSLPKHRIRVSELAAVLGQHQYQDQTIALSKWWARENLGCSFDELSRLSTKFPRIEREQRASLFAALRSATVQYASESGEKVLKSVLVSELLDNQPVDEHVRSRLSTALDSPKSQMKDSVMQVLQQAGIDVAKALGFVTSLPLLMSLSTFETLERICQQNNGSANESADLHQLSLKLDRTLVQSKRQVMSREFCCSDGSTPVNLVGSVDALDEQGHVVETKHRRNRLFQQVPLYERIQLHGYMFLTSTTSAIHTQTYRDTSVETHIPWDPELWQHLEAGLSSISAFDRRVSDSPQHTVCVRAFVQGGITEDELKEALGFQWLESKWYHNNNKPTTTSTTMTRMIVPDD